MSTKTKNCLIWLASLMVSTVDIELVSINSNCCVSVQCQQGFLMYWPQTSFTARAFCPCFCGLLTWCYLCCLFSHSGKRRENKQVRSRSRLFRFIWTSCCSLMNTLSRYEHSKEGAWLRWDNRAPCRPGTATDMHMCMKYYLKKWLLIKECNQM